MKKLFLTLAITLLSLTSALSFGVGSAGASAYGCTFGNPFIDPNTWCVALVGTGTFVNYVNGDFGGGSVVCDSYMSAVFYDTSWHWYQTVRTGTLWGCTNSHTFKLNFNAYKRVGNMCAELHYKVPLYGSRVMTKCFGIHF